MIINLFGNSLKVYKCELELDFFKQIEVLRVKSNLDIQAFFTNLEIMNHLGFENWTSLASEKEKTYFEILPRNSIEIKVQGKKTLKISATDLLENNLLFKMYNTKNTIDNVSSKTDKKTLYFFQYEIGLAAKYEIKEKENFNFNMDDICFNLIENQFFSEHPYLNGISYKNEKMKLKKQDSLTRYMQVKIVNE